MEANTQLLIINGGSSSIKLSVFLKCSDSGALKPLWRGHLKKLFSTQPTLEIESQEKRVMLFSKIESYAAALKLMFDQLCLDKTIQASFCAIGHRVVHGGDFFKQSHLINEDVLKKMEELCLLAPLHNPLSLEGIHVARAYFSAQIPHIAVFDTAFHAHLSPHVAYYPIPFELSQRYHIKRYGFHGISHAYLWEKYVDLHPHKKSSARLITLHLGNGCSLAAVKGGISIDTTMGFTPLDGLMMAARSGSLDPAIMSYLCEKEKKSPADVEFLLNHESGLLGVSGQTSDMQELLSLYEQHERATLAVDMFSYHLLKAVGSFIAILGGVDALLFTGGIGENACMIRKKLLRELAWLGAELDESKNTLCHNLPVGQMQEITTPQSSFQAFVVGVDENSAIAQQVAALV